MAQVNVNIRELFGGNFQKGEKLIWADALDSTSFLGKRNRVIRVFTTHAVASILNGELKEHAFYHEIYGYQVQLDNNTGIQDLIFYGYTVFMDFYQAREYVESITLFQLSDVAKAPDIFVEHWKKREPTHLLNLGLKGLCSVYGFDYSSTPDAVLLNQISGSFDGKQFLMELPEVLPLKQVRITIQCPNPTKEFFYLYPQLDEPATDDPENDLPIGDQEFDETFIIQTSNETLLTSILTPDIKDRIMDCSNVSQCILVYGNYKEAINKEAKDIKFKFKDQEDVLDFQLLESEGTRTEKSVNTNSETENNPNQFIFEAKLDHRLQFNVHSLSKFIEICVECTQHLTARIAKLSE